MASKQKTQVQSSGAKIYFDISRFDSWEEIGHVQVNLFSLETGANLVSGAGQLVHQKDANGNLLYVGPTGQISTASSGTPYYIASNSLKLILINSIGSDADGKYITIPGSYLSAHLGKPLKTQVRFHSGPIPAQANITPAWITESLKQGNLSEWSSPSAFKVIARPSVSWEGSLTSTNVATPTFSAKFSTTEKSSRLSAELNGEKIDKKMSLFEGSATFDFGQSLKTGANTFKLELETEGGLLETKPYSVNYSPSAIDQSYSIPHYRTKNGGIEIEVEDSYQSNRFFWVAPKAPPNMRYPKGANYLEFVGASRTMFLLSDSAASIKPSASYHLEYRDSKGSSSELKAIYHYTDGTTETKTVGSMTSGARKEFSSIPGPTRTVRTSYLALQFPSNSNPQIEKGSTYLGERLGFPVHSYQIRRASSADSYRRWDILTEFRPQASAKGRWTYFDNSAQAGTTYKYAVVGKDKDGKTGPMSAGTFAVSSADYIWMSTANYKSINFAYDATISGMRIARREALVETLGNKYPYLSISGDTNYKTFSLSATLFHEMDPEKETLKGFYSREASPGLSVEAIEADLLSEFIHGREKHFVLEREFRQELLKELSDTTPVLLKVDTDQAMIVVFTMMTVSPRRELGNVIASFSASVSEVAECTIENLKKYGLLNTVVKEKE